MFTRGVVNKIIIYSFLYLVTLGIFYSINILEPRTDSHFSWIRVVIIFFASVLLVKYMVYMLVSPWYDVWAKWHHAHRFGDGGDNNPKVSILVPAWNEAVGIVTTIESILESSYKNLEIIIVNDGSTDDSHAIIRKFIERYRLRLLHANSSGVQIDIRYAYKKMGVRGRH